MARILIVDDEPDLLGFLSEELRKRGHEADTALSGEEAIQRIQGNRPDLILLDIRMQGMGGLETLKRVHGLDPDIGVVIVTAIRDDRLAEEALKLGVRDYVTKPVDFAHLEMVVRARSADLGGRDVSREWSRGEVSHAGLGTSPRERKCQ